MKIIRAGSIASKQAPETNFTGNVRIDSPFSAEDPGRAGGAIVTFEPGARTNWHTHPLGQTLIVTQGVGWTQCEGGPKTEIRQGDIIWCPCQRRHWHGATATTAMSHVAIAEAKDGKSVEWMEPVPDKVYLATEVDRD